MSLTAEEWADAYECQQVLKELRMLLDAALTPGGCEGDRVRFELTKRQIATLSVLVDKALGVH